MSVDLGRMRSMLAALAAPTAGVMRRDRRRREVRVAWSALGGSLLVVPIGYLLLIAVAAMVGTDLRLSGWWLLSAWSIVPAVSLLLAIRRANHRAVSDVAALAEIDRQLGLEDRLSVAREFVDAAQPGGFMLAAIADAGRCLARAEAARCELLGELPPLRVRPLGFAIAGLAILLVADRIERRPATVAAPQIEASLPATAIEGVLDPVVTSEPGARAAPKQVRAGDPQPGGDAGTDDPHRPDNKRSGRDPNGAGRSAAARDVTGGGTDRGQPSQQAQSAQKKTADQGKAPPPKSDNPEDRKQRDRPPEPQEQSGGTEGAGSGRGSSRSPTASPWQSKDQVVSEPQKEIDHEEEIFDDDDESDSRGGLQPTLRSKKPPVNRDVGTGFGAGKPPPDSNGRGAGGGRKKQRGVPQLIIGRTSPDHLSSPPNPGRTKVTQEQIEPQMRDSERLPAADRGERSTKTGHMTQRALSPWLQDVVRKFFLPARDTRRTE